MGSARGGVHRRVVVVVVAAATLGLAAMSSAFACATLADLLLSRQSGPAGTRVTATGSGYTAGGLLSDPVVLRWNGVDGIELARTQPDASGRISAAFTVPSGQPGYYVVVGVQRDARGENHVGTPSRASFQVLAPGQQVPTTLVAPTTAATPPAPTTPTTLAPTTSVTGPRPTTSRAPSTSTSTVSPTSTSTLAPTVDGPAVGLAAAPLVAGELGGGEAVPLLAVAIALVAVGGVAAAWVVAARTGRLR